MQTFSSSMATRSLTFRCLADPEKNLAVIMKDGKIDKNAPDPTMALTGSR